MKSIMDEMKIFYERNKMKPIGKNISSNKGSDRLQIQTEKITW